MAVLNEKFYDRGSNPLTNPMRLYHALINGNGKITL